MQYCAYCPTCKKRTNIQVEMLSTASHPTCPTCGAPLRTSTETMQNTPLADVWIVPQLARQTAEPACERLPGGLSTDRQSAFENLLRHANLQEAELAGYTEL